MKKNIEVERPGNRYCKNVEIENKKNTVTECALEIIKKGTQVHIEKKKNPGNPCSREIEKIDKYAH